MLNNRLAPLKKKLSGNEVSFGEKPGRIRLKKEIPRVRKRLKVRRPIFNVNIRE